MHRKTFRTGIHGDVYASSELYPVRLLLMSYTLKHLVTWKPASANVLANYNLACPTCLFQVFLLKSSAGTDVRLKTCRKQCILRSTFYVIFLFSKVSVNCTYSPCSEMNGSTKKTVIVSWNVSRNRRSTNNILVDL